MKISLRIRYFAWLSALLATFVVVQTVVYTVIELATFQWTPGLNLRDQLLEVLMGASAGFLLLPFLLIPAWWISRRMLTPIHAISDTAQRIGRGSFDERIDTTLMPDDETLALARCINGAFDRYRDAVDRLDRFIGDAAHQLRTPLAAVRTAGEVAAAQSRTPEEYRESLGDILESLARLSRLVEQMLMLARLRSDELLRHFAPVDLADVVRRTCETYALVCEDRGVCLSLHVPDSACTMTGNQDLLQEMLGNLVDNATKHTPDGGRIDVSVREGSDAHRLTVKDTGPGISPEEIERVFSRFQRGKAGNPSGTGLGLALVVEIARAHGGQVAVERESDWGAVFVVRLPRKTA